MTILNAFFRRAAQRLVDHSTPPPMTTLSGHIPMLDGVRGAAILLVMIYHFSLGTSGGGVATRVLARCASAGWCGVDLFFVLSGFLITGILADTKASSHRFRNFYARRALRIFPLYYCTLALIFISLPFVTKHFRNFEGVEEAMVWLGLYWTNALVAVRGSWFPLSHFWSLAVEEHFYVFWPAVIFWLGRTAAMTTCVAVILLALMVRVWMTAQGAVLAAYCLTACRMDALAVGSLLALAVRGPGGVAAVLPTFKAAGIASAAGLTVIIGLSHGLAFHDPIVQTAGYPLLDILFASMIIVSLSSAGRGRWNRLLEGPSLRRLGRYSYGLYVYNSIFLLFAEGSSLLVILTARTGSPSAARLLYITVGFTTTLGASWPSWHLVEKHFLKLKRFFPSTPAGIA